MCVKPKTGKKAFLLFLASAMCFGELTGGTGLFRVTEAQAFGNMTGSILLNQSYEEKLKEAQDKKKQLEDKKEETKKRLEENEKLKDDILAFIEELDGQIYKLGEELDELAAQITEAEESLEETKLELSDAMTTEQKQYEMMKRRVQYMYENGTDSMLDVFLGAESISDLLNRVEYRKRITEYDDRLLDSYIEAKLVVEQHKKMLEAKLDELATMKEQKEFDQETLLLLSEEKNTELVNYLAAIEMDEDLFADYSEQVVSASMEIDEIIEEERRRIEEEERKRREEEERRRKEEEERKRKAEEAKKAAEEAAKKAAQESDAKRLAAIKDVTVQDVSDPDKMIWPLPGDGRIYSYFGPRKAPIKGASTYHKGLDIGGVMGASIVAVLSGTVADAGYNLSRGYYVTIDHGGGYQTIYMHCSKLIAKKGDKVLQGEVIGLVGSTGISTGPHVHFSVVVNGVNVDPLKYVKYSQ